MKNELIKKLVSSCYDLLQEVSKQSFDKDLLRHEITKLTNQKNIALSFMVNPTKKKHFKKIIAIHEQYENEIKDILKLDCGCDFCLRQSNGNITHTFLCDKCKK